MRPLFLLAIALLATPSSAFEDPVDASLAAGLAAEARFDPRGALAAFRAADQLRPQDAFILQKIARQLSDATFLETDKAVRRQLAEEALAYAKRSTELAPQSAENALSVAILYGKLGLHASVSDRVAFARLIHLHAERALALDPDYAWAHHVLGEWHLNVAELGATKRMLAGLLFGGLPKPSRDAGLNHLRRAVALEPEALAHQVALGLALKKAGRTEEAAQHLRYALTLPDRTIYDPAARERARAGLSP